MASIQSEKKRGAFILFEGVDRSGKTSQSKNLFNNFINQNIPCEWMCFPDRKSPLTGIAIDSYLKKMIDLSPETAHLLFALNRREKAEQIVESLNKGITIIMDRYFYSGIVYTLSRKEFENNTWVDLLDQSLPLPDVLFFMKMQKGDLEKRLQTTENPEYFEKIEILWEIQKKFDKLFDENETTYVEKIDVTKSFEENATYIGEKCISLLNEIKDKPITYY